MRLPLVIASLLSLLVGSVAFGCGESLYRVGKGVTYREYTVPLPGNLLVYGGDGNSQELAAHLERAGHNVTVATSTSEFVRLAERTDFQVVIARYRDYDDFRSLSVLSNATYLPIAMEGVDEDEAEQHFEHVMVATKHEIKHYLKTIHRILKSA